MKKIALLLMAAVLFQSTVGAYPSYKIDDTAPGILYERDEYDFTLSGWDVDKRGGEVISNRLVNYEIRDTSTRFPIILKHSFDECDNFIYESSFNFSDLTEGFYVRFLSGNDLPVIEVSADYMGWYTSGQRAAEFQFDKVTFVRIKAENGAYTLYIDGRNCGSYSYNGSVSEIEIGTPDEYKCSFKMGYTLMCSDCAVNERFSELTDEWEITGNAQIADSYESGTEDADALLLTDGSAATGFQATGENIIAELKCRLDNAEEFEMRLGDAGIKAQNEQFTFAEISVDYTPEVWQTLRIETDGTEADYYINGSYAGSGPVNGIADSVRISATGSAYVDDLIIYADNSVQGYPSMTSSDALGLNDDVYVAMQACYLMRNGRNRGWDTFTPYNDTKPYLGFYDDGNPEVMDWELRWMAQHGVDYVLPCFYQPGNYKGGIVRPTNTAFESGYFPAKNSKYVSYAFNLCNSFAKHLKPADKELTQAQLNENIINFTQYVVPYFVERYFTDERYMKIDNKPLLYIWSPIDFIEHYGQEGVRTIFTALEEACIQKGLAGAYFFAGTDFTHTSAEITEYADMGFDYTFNYTTGTSQGDSAEVQMDILNSRKTMPLDAVANVSVGQNQRAWYKYTKNHSWMEASEYKNLLGWVKSSYMRSFESSSLASKMITIDNWNELGEGHFVQPTEYQGFGYLDAIRSTFTSGGSHTDTVPTAAQKQRLRGLFPENRKILRYIRPFTGTEIPEKVQTVWDFSGGAKPIVFDKVNSVRDISYTDEGLSAVAFGGDPVLTVSVDMDTKDIQYVHVRMKINPSDTSLNSYVSQIFFATDEYPVVRQEQAVGEYLRRGEFVDVYYDMSENKYWSGKLNTIRIDPMEQKGSFVIEKIEFLGDTAHTAVINGEDYVLPCPPIETDERLLPVESAGGICSRLNFYTEYHDESLVIKGEKTLEMTIGSKEAILDGEQIILGAAPVIFRGAAMVPVSAFEYLEAAVTEEDSYRTVISQDIDIPVKSYHPPFQWHFDMDAEGWKTGSCVTLSDVSDGVWRQRARALSANPEASDPSMVINLTETPIDTSIYTAIEIRMKNVSAGGVMQMFFSEKAGNFTEDSSIKQDISNSSDYTVYTLDMSGLEAWNNKNIKALRFDPVSKPGMYEIDYIKVIAPPEAEYSTTPRFGIATATFTNYLSVDDVSAKGIIAFYDDSGRLYKVVESEEATVKQKERVTFDFSGLVAELGGYSHKMFVWKNGEIPCSEKYIVTK